MGSNRSTAAATGALCVPANPLLKPAELAYIWPSFNNGTPIAPLFDAGERQLANEMTKYWGAFATNGRPRVAGQTNWPRFDKHGSTISLRPGGQSVVIDQAEFDAEHQCGFWSTFS